MYIIRIKSYLKYKLITIKIKLIIIIYIMYITTKFTYKVIHIIFENLKRKNKG